MENPPRNTLRAEQKGSERVWTIGVKPLSQYRSLLIPPPKQKWHKGPEALCSNMVQYQFQQCLKKTTHTKNRQIKWDVIIQCDSRTEHRALHVSKWHWTPSSECNIIRRVMGSGWIVPFFGFLPNRHIFGIHLRGWKMKPMQKCQKLQFKWPLEAGKKCESISHRLSC